MGVKFCTLNYTVENKKKITVQITSNNNNILYYIDDNGGFIKEVILRVRACYIDEITLASNYIEFVTYYKSKITIKKSGFVGYYFVAIYIK